MDVLRFYSVFQLPDAMYVGTALIPCVDLGSKPYMSFE